MDTNAINTESAIVNVVIQQLVSSIADEVIRKLKAEGNAVAALEPETLKESLLTLLRSDGDIHEEVRCINDERFNDVESRLDSIENADEDQTNLIDANDSDFDAAVMQVLRNNI